MPELLRCVASDSIITGWDFSTGASKCVAYGIDGSTIAEVRFPTDLYREGGVSELSLMLLEGQVRSTTRGIAAELRQRNRLHNWIAGGISATHHTAGRIDRLGNSIRRAICWNDYSLEPFHRIGLERLGGQDAVRQRVHGPWAIRYTLSHLLKDEAVLSRADWERTYKVLPHASLAIGYLTGRFDVVSVSSAASTGIMDLNSNQWCPAMLDALADLDYRVLAAQQLPEIIQDMNQPISPIAEQLASEIGLDQASRPLVFPPSDDQAAGLIGGGAVQPGEFAVILGNSAVVNSSSGTLPKPDSTLDCMKLNWGPFLWMRCYNNGAQFLDLVVGRNPDWSALEAGGRSVAAGAGGIQVLPFAYPEPSRGVHCELFRWLPEEPSAMPVRYRASLEALAYLMRMGVEEHRNAGQQVRSVTVSGGIARSNLMCDILASVLNVTLRRLQSDEGPALGAAVTSLVAVENHRRRQQKIAHEYRAEDAVAQMVRFREPVQPVEAWVRIYEEGYRNFCTQLSRAISNS
jgi:sugar (pentulose or hexulose) kinase